MADLIVPGRMARGQVIPRNLVVKMIVKAIKRERRQALYLFKSVIEQGTTKEEMLAGINALLEQTDAD